MNVLIVFAHPQRDSLCGAFLNNTLEGLESNESVDRVEVLDLYAEDFDPLLRFGPEKRRRDLYKDPAFEKYRRQIDDADLLVYIYPIWWGRPPAVLSGYFDQIFTSGFAYKNIPGCPLPEGLLKGKRAVCVSTMRGPRLYERLFLRDANRVLLKKAVFNFVGIKKIRFFEFGGMEKPEGRQGVCLRRVRNYMSGLR